MGGVPRHGYDLRYEAADGGKRILDEEGTLQRTLARGESLNTSKRDLAKLAPSATERVQVIKSIFTMYADQGKGFKSVAEALNRDDVPTPRGPRWQSRCGSRTGRRHCSSNSFLTA